MSSSEPAAGGADAPERVRSVPEAPQPAPLALPPVDATFATGLIGGVRPDHVLSLQRTSGNQATTRWLATARAATTPYGALGMGWLARLQEAGTLADPGIPTGGIPVNKIGVVSWDRTPRLRLRHSPSTKSDDNIVSQLEFNTRMQVLKSFPDDWYFVSTLDGRMGYAGSQYIKTDLPEPGAKLHRVEGGSKGYAINIAEEYFGSDSPGARPRDVRWGQDLRFYVNAIAFVNDLHVPDSTSGWKEVRFKAGNFIWIPSKNFAQSLKGTISTGSITYEALDALGLAGYAERLAELYKDFEAAFEASKRHFWPALKKHVADALMNVVMSLVVMMIGAIVIVAVMTVIGAVVIGLITGGAGTAIGAEFGFEAGMMILEWLGLVFLVAWLGQAIYETAAAFAKFMSMVVDAHGDPKKLDLAGKQWAEAKATLIGNLIEAAALWAASVGIETGIAKIRSTRFGKALGETFFDWLRETGGKREGERGKGEGERGKGVGERGKGEGERGKGEGESSKGEGRERERERQREEARPGDEDVAVTDEDVHTDDLAPEPDPMEPEVDPAICFPAGTLIHTPDGTQPIESLAVGDPVLAYDFDAGRAVARAVTSVTRGSTERWIRTHLAVGGELRATPPHKFWVESEQGWIAAEVLEPGMTLRLIDGSTDIVADIAVEKCAAAEPTFNFGVDETANYYAGERGILVHNLKLKRSRLARLMRPGYSNYDLINAKGEIYYSGMFGPNETEASVKRRHANNRNRFDPKKGDKMRVRRGTRTYGESRLVEHRRAIENDTVIGREGNNYRGNRQDPINSDKLAEYETYVDEYLRSCA
jgi:Family of unknown function (DUF6861)/Pretoxin HINT domain